MSPEVRHPLVWLLVVLAMSWPAQAQAYPSLSLGLGAAKTCDSGGGDCSNGARGEVLIDLFGKDRSGGEGKASDSSSTSGGNTTNFNCFNNVHSNGGHHTGGGSGCGNGGGKDAGAILVALVAIVLVIVVAYGIIWAIIALASSQVSVGLYVSDDYYPSAHDPNDPTGALKQLEIRRYGVQASFYPIADAWFRLHVGVGSTSTRLRANVSANDEDYREGFSTKGGLAIAPPPGQRGLFVEYEGEYLSLAARTFNDVIHNNQPQRAPEYRLTSAVMGGYTFAW